MIFREATRQDHELMRQHIGGNPSMPLTITDAWVTDNDDGQRYWIAVLPYAFGQIRLQLWLERVRGEAYPAIYHEL